MAEDNDFDQLIASLGEVLALADDDQSSRLGCHRRAAQSSPAEVDGVVAAQAVEQNLLDTLWSYMREFSCMLTQCLRAPQQIAEHEAAAEIRLSLIKQWRRRF